MQKNRDLVNIIFSFFFISFMSMMCLWILKPFIIGFTWGGIIVIATWPLFLKTQRVFWNIRFLAISVMALTLILVFVIPIILFIHSVIKNSSLLIIWLNTNHFKSPELYWLNSIPIVGQKFYLYYHNLVDTSGKTLISQLQPYIGRTTSFIVSQAEHLGHFMIHLGLMITSSIFFYWFGDKIENYIQCLSVRVAPRYGKTTILLGIQAIRAVACGVVITGCTQGLLGGIGLSISGIPFSTILTVVIIFSCLVQLGSLIILIPAIIWLYWTSNNTEGTVLLIWSVLIGALEIFLRSFLIKKGIDLPIMLILVGIIGGLLSFGIIGLFVGPVVLAVSYQLILSWIKQTPTLCDNDVNLMDQSKIEK
ncbi:AI-2E family transporter YdiK [Candidatus Erwinia haradaeae]|nr:AI-2E family transporter YdiK [Candidatus Erwinia haradaeae]